MRAAYHESRRARRANAFRAELPRPFNERHDVDPSLAIFVPIDDGGAVAALRDLAANRILDKVREAMHEAHWWFMEDGFVGWVIAVRQLPSGDLEVFTGTGEHRNVLQEYTVWETVFLERLKQESCRYGVSPVGLGPSQVSKHLDGDRRALYIQQLFDWNKSRIRQLKCIEDILSIEARPTNYGNPIVVVNLAKPGIANEFIKRGIQWGETQYQGRKYVREWSLYQCEECWSFGHTSVSCTQGVRCRKCTLRHSEYHCKPIDLECVNCGGPHTATTKDCPQKENEARRRRELPSCIRKYWPVENWKAKPAHRNQNASSPNPEPRPARENQAEKDEIHREGSIMTTDKPDDQDQHTDHISTELLSADAAETGKHDIATAKEGDGTLEHPETISTAKESEDDPISDPRTRNIMKLLHGGSYPAETRNEKSRCEIQEQEAEIAHHQQPDNNKKSSAKASRQARRERRTRRMKDPHKQKAEEPQVTGVAEGETTGTPAGESNEAEITYIVAPAAEGKRAEEVVSKEAGRKQPQAVSKAEPKVIDTTKPQPMKAPQDQKENSIRASQDEITKPQPMKAQQDQKQDSIRGPQNSNTKQSAVAQKAILETPPILPPLIRRFQSRNPVGGN